MTKQQHLDEAAKAADGLSYGAYRPVSTSVADVMQSIRAHATTLEALAERDRVLGEIAELADEKRTAQADRLALILELAAPYRAKVDQDAEDLKAVLMKWRSLSDDPERIKPESFAAALAKFREIVAQRGEVK